jgi:hypothetical protein
MGEGEKMAEISAMVRGGKSATAGGTEFAMDDRGNWAMDLRGKKTKA